MKQVVVGVKVNPDELTLWKEKAGACGLTVPSWLRGLANGFFAAPLGDVPPLKPVRKPRKKVAVSVAEKMASDPPRGTSATVTWMDEVPDFEELAHLPDDAPLPLPGADAVSVGGGEPMIASFSKPPKKRHAKCVTEKCERIGPSCPICIQANAIRF